MGFSYRMMSMLPKDRQKMCTNCDGRIPLDAEVCPYCAADMKTTLGSTSGAKELHHQSLQDSLTSLYTPPYGKNSSFLNQGGEKKEVSPLNKTEPLKEPMVEKRFNHTSPSLGAPTIPVESTADPNADQEKNGFWPILFLSIGTNLLTLGLLQLFFSDHGFLRLEWDSSYWFIYCLAALPLFFFGFKKANLLK
jgi:hypothetical protein